MVERHPYKVDVVGSSPAPPTTSCRLIFSVEISHLIIFLYHNLLTPYIMWTKMTSPSRQGHLEKKRSLENKKKEPPFLGKHPSKLFFIAIWRFSFQEFLTISMPVQNQIFQNLFDEELVLSSLVIGSKTLFSV